MVNDKDFEQWLTHEETCLKVSKELDDWCENDVFVDELYRRYRQLEKDNAELLAAIWPLIDESHKVKFAEIDNLEQVYNKHKGE